MKSLPLAFTAFVLAACASIPPPTDHLAVARSLVQEAQGLGAAQSAPLEFQRARDKLAQADQAMRAKDYTGAAALADEAQVDAQLSLTTAQAVKARRAASEIEQSNRTLGQELERRR